MFDFFVTYIQSRNTSRQSLTYSICKIKKKILGSIAKLPNCLPLNGTTNVALYIEVIEKHILIFMINRSCNMFQRNSALRRAKNWSGTFNKSYWGHVIHYSCIEEVKNGYLGQRNDCVGTCQADWLIDFNGIVNSFRIILCPDTKESRPHLTFFVYLSLKFSPSFYREMNFNNQWRNRGVIFPVCPIRSICVRMWHMVILKWGATPKLWHVQLFQKMLGPFSILFIETPQPRT